MSPLIEKIFGKESQASSLITLVYFILVFVFWWHYFYDATFKGKKDEEPEYLYFPSFSEIAETIGDFVDLTGVLALGLFGVLIRYAVKLL